MPPATLKHHSIGANEAEIKSKQMCFKKYTCTMYFKRTSKILIHNNSGIIFHLYFFFSFLLSFLSFNSLYSYHLDQVNSTLLFTALWHISS